ncbi:MULTISPECIES: hypothetical protein [unclassified Micromonospora]|uniref:hypothetical protein n=1 Tax=unclassified Micromonospora TaxID=2617518 RepID=UPI003A89C7F5
MRHHGDQPDVHAGHRPAGGRSSDSDSADDLARRIESDLWRGGHGAGPDPDHGGTMPLPGATMRPDPLQPVPLLVVRRVDEELVAARFDPLRDECAVRSSTVTTPAELQVAEIDQGVPVAIHRHDSDARAGGQTGDGVMDGGAHHP